MALVTNSPRSRCIFQTAKLGTKQKQHDREVCASKILCEGERLQKLSTEALARWRCWEASSEKGCRKVCAKRDLVWFAFLLQQRVSVLTHLWACPDHASDLC